MPKHLARRVHDLYFNPLHEEFAPRTMWSLSNAITSGFKELDLIPQFKATALSDISGFSVQEIIRALLAGERDPKALAKLRDPRCQASEQEIVQSLREREDYFCLALRVRQTGI